MSSWFFHFTDFAEKTQPNGAVYSRFHDFGQDENNPFFIPSRGNNTNHIGFCGLFDK